MDNEPYRDLTHHEARDLIPHLWRESTFGAITEATLPNGKIADVILNTIEHSIVIVEVKAVLLDSLVSQAWEKYGGYCHQLYVAIPNLRVNNLAEIPFLLEWQSDRLYVGLLGVYRDALAVIRPAKSRPMSRDREDQIAVLFETS